MRILITTILFCYYCVSEAQIIRLDLQDFQADTSKVNSISNLDFFAIGNANTIFSLTVNQQTKFNTKNLNHLLLANISTIFSNSDALDNRGYFHYRLQKHIAKKTWYAEAFAQSRFNELLKLGRRDLIGGGLRMHLESKDKYALNFGTGLMLDFETEIDYRTFRFHERWNNYLQLQYKNEKFKINNNTYFQPDINNFADFRLSSTLSFQFNLGKGLMFDSGFDINWDTQPIQDVIPVTFTIRNGISYQFKK